MKPLKFIHITKTAGTSIEDTAFKKGILWGRFDKEYGKRWHKPFPQISDKIKIKYDWFTVVRNPYDRILSEFYCKWTIPKNKNCDKQKFNEIIRDNILCRIVKQHKLDFHYTEQYRYIDSRHKIHIIKYENLCSEFDSLMLLYGLDLKLNEHTNISLKKRYSIIDFDQETISLINTVYQKDFEIFNYKIQDKL